MTQNPEFTDENPERDFANSERLAFILKITPRQVRRLAADRILPRMPDGSFHINNSVDAFVGYKTAPRPKAAEDLDRRRTELLQRRLEREKTDTIEMTDALETIDLTTNAFLMGFDEIAEATIAIAAAPDRAATACAHARAGMIEQFAKHRLALKTGKRDRK